MTPTAEVPREQFFSDAEYARRLAAVRRAMAQRGVEVLVTPHPSNICYLVGHFTVNLWDLMFLVVPLEGPPLFLCWQFERGRFKASATGAELVSWDSGVDPAGFLVAELQRRGLGQRCHVDTGSPYTPHSDVQRILSALGGQPITGLVEGVRLVKSREEIQWFERIAPLTDQAVDAATAAIRPGASDYAIAAAACSSLVASGSEFFCIDPIVCIGWRAGTPHSNRGGEIAREGDPVFLELGGTLARYTCPIMRTRVAGRPGPELADLARYSSDCLDAMIDAMRPGVAASEVAARGRRVLEPILGDVTFHHVYGYSLGIAFPPTWIENPHFLLVAENHAPLEAGMVFHLPLTLRRLGRLGAGFSEAVEVTESGARIFSRNPRRLVP